MFKRILVPFAFDAGSQAALAFARRLIGAGGTIHLVHVVEEIIIGATYEAYVDIGDVVQACRDKLAEIARAGAGATRITWSIEKGSTWRGVLAAAKTAKSEAIFIGSHGRRGAARLLLGSVAERVVRESPVPVCVVKQDARGGAIRRIGLATDLGAATDEAIRLTRSLATERKARLFVIHVTERERMPGGGVLGRQVAAAAIHQQRIEEESDTLIMCRQLEKEGMKVKEVLSVGRAPEKIAAVARRHELDLLVMGTHARKGLEHLFMGSVATQTIRLAPCPVLVVKPKD